MNEPLIVRTTRADGSVGRRFYEPSVGARVRAAPSRERATPLRPSLAHAASLLSLGVGLVGALALGAG